MGTYQHKWIFYAKYLQTWMFFFYMGKFLYSSHDLMECLTNLDTHTLCVSFDFEIHQVQWQLWGHTFIFYKKMSSVRYKSALGVYWSYKYRANAIFQINSIMCDVIQGNDYRCLLYWMLLMRVRKQHDSAFFVCKDFATSVSTLRKLYFSKV